jgi:hypothetical protein
LSGLNTYVAFVIPCKNIFENAKYQELFYSEQTQQTLRFQIKEMLSFLPKIDCHLCKKTSNKQNLISYTRRSRENCSTFLI